MKIAPRILPSRGETSRKAKSQAEQTGQPITFPAPLLGLVTKYDPTKPMPGCCAVAQNGFFTTTGFRFRGGMTEHGLTADEDNIVTMHAYRFGITQKMFVATEENIYDATSPAAPPATITAAVTGMTSGDWVSTQFTNTGGSYLTLVNGLDNPQQYNGSAWSEPTFTFAGSETKDGLSFVFNFKNREIFLYAGSMDMYYGATSAISGALTLFPVGGVMKHGGSLLLGFDWSVAAGDGLSNKMVLVSTEGEIAVYGGIDPSSDLKLENLYKIGKPLGKHAYLSLGGEAFIATVDGLIPMSKIVSDTSEQGRGLIAVSQDIEDLWRKAANAVQTGWQFKLWNEGNIVFVSFPENDSLPQTTFAFNAQTFKWSVITGWTAACFETISGSIYFGSADGYVYRAEQSGSDNGTTFTVGLMYQFDPVGNIGTYKKAARATMTFVSTSELKPRLFARADGNSELPTWGQVTSFTGEAEGWDVGDWDVALYDAGVSQFVESKFIQDVRAEGRTITMGWICVMGGDDMVGAESRWGLLQASQGKAEG